MKKKNLLLLSLVALSLTGCFENSTSKNTATSTTPTSTQQTSVTPSDTSKKDTTSTSGTPASDTTILTDTVDTSKWPTAVINSMIKYLDNTLLPYIDLGITIPANVYADWDTSCDTLKIRGGISDAALTADALNNAVSTYKSYGWNASSDGTKMTATNKAGNITVTYYNGDGYNRLDAKYDEPFDATKLTAWSQEILDSMNENMGNHGADVPFVYLGTVNPTYEWDSDHSTFIVTGGYWDDRIVDLAIAAFKAANNSITNEDNKWTYEDSTNTYGRTFNATIKLADKSKLSVSIEAPYTDATTIKKCDMHIVYTKPFAPTTGDMEWDSEVTDAFEEYFDGHSVPYFYIGTTDFDVSSTNPSYVRFYGLDDDTWDDQVFDECIDALTKDNVGVATANQWTWKYDTHESDDSLQQLVCTKEFEDGCSISFIVRNISSSQNRAEVFIQYEKGYIGTATNWENDTLTCINSYLDGNTIPYVWLGMGEDEYEYASWDSSKNTLTVRGASYFKKLLTGAESVYASHTDWTGGIVTKTGTNWDESTYSYQVFEAEKVLDATTGKKLTVTIGASFYNKQTGEPSDDCQMTVAYYKPYIVPTGDDAKWDSNTKEEIIDNEKYLYGHSDKVPYVYLNSSNIYNDSYGNAGEIYLVGGPWDDKVLDHAVSQLQAAGYADAAIVTDEDDEDNKKVTGTLTLDDGCKLTITVSKDFNDCIEMDVVLTQNYKATTASSWSTDVASAMTTAIGEELPYFDLGATHVSVNPNGDYEGQFKIETGVWDDAILDSAYTALKAGGWTVCKNNYSDSDKKVVAYKKATDGTYLGMYVQEESGSTGLYAYKMVDNDTTTTHTKSEWSESDLTYIKGKVGEDTSMVPFLYMGESDYVLSGGRFGQTWGGDVYSLDAIIKYYETLVSIGYQKVTLNITKSAFNIKASYTDDAGNVTSITVMTGSGGSYTSVSKPVFTVSYTKASTNA